MVRQGWNEGTAPVLWSEWSQDGLLLRQEVFAHVPGGQPVESGVEPLFAWVRLSVRETCAGLPLEPECGFLLKINAPHFSYTMDKFGHQFPVEDSAYPRLLVAEPAAYASDTGLRLVEDDRVQLALAPGQPCSADLLPQVEGSRDLFLFVSMPAVVGTHVDLLLPMLPCERETLDRELALGYDEALAEANSFWAVLPETAATVDVPEAPLNELVRRSLQFAEVVAERNPANGYYSLLTGSLFYANLWATPLAMTAIMCLDALGYHESVAEYLEVFRAEQGTVVAPGDGFELHPGYLSSPQSLTSIDWLSDHGALLYAIAEHALLAGDANFADRWLEPIVRACEFIHYARGRADHPGVPGLLPPAVATDSRARLQAVWNDGWNYKGLTTAVKLLRQAGHPRAEEFATEAAAYRATFQAAFRARTAEMPAWTDGEGGEPHLTPTALFGDTGADLCQNIYLDTGPLFLVYAGLFPAEDPLMRSTLQWFREGPQTRHYRRDASYSQVPCLDHEMSSHEPCYSWNVFHPWQLGDREKYLEGMYSLLAGSLSRQTFTLCETRGGITGVTPALLPFWLMRLAVIDDQLAEGELHLLRLAPLAWFTEEQETVFADVPTEYGPVSLRWRLEGDTLQVSFTPRFRGPTPRMRLHRPPLAGVRRACVNGATVDFTDGPLGLEPGEFGAPPTPVALVQ